jgi:transcriptional regulator GlxA family with amidase domain
MIDDRASHRVAVLAVPGLGPLDFGIALYSFGFAPYELVVCGEAPVEEVLAKSLVVPTQGLEALDAADTVIVPGHSPTTLRPSDNVVAALRRARDGGARIASISTGAFTLGHAGLLDGHQATTHWMHVDSLATTFPNVDVRRDVLYVISSQLYTCAGAAAGIDMFLHMVRTDLGAAVANQRRRRLVAPPPRSSDERQFFETFVPHPDEEPVLATRSWSLAHLHEPLTLASMAARANMSTRNFSRRFVAETGDTPMKWLQTARIDYARELLESTDYNIADIAVRCGLGTRANFRRIFIQYVGISPREYRFMHRTPLAIDTVVASDPPIDAPPEAGTLPS